MLYYILHILYIMLYCILLFIIYYALLYITFYYILRSIVYYALLYITLYSTLYNLVCLLYFLALYYHYALQL
jgi:hypothetical protein